MPDNVLIAVSASAPASAIARAMGRMSATFGESFHEQRQIRHAPDRRRDLARGVGIDRELEPATADVRARDVELDPGDARDSLEAARDLDVVADGLACDVDEDRDLPRRPGRRVLLDDRIDARVLQTDRVEHPAGRLGHAGVGFPMRGLSVVPLQQIAPRRSTSMTSPYSMP
jgi:hypothetical protein